MRCLTINKAALKSGWKQNKALQLTQVYKSLFERIYEGPDLRLSIGLKWAYIFVFCDDDYQNVCNNLLKQ